LSNSRSQDRNVAPRITIRIDLRNGQIGPGKVRLLELVEQTGSIRQAAAAMKMSYRRAWLLLQSLEACFGVPIVEATTGGKQGGGARLSKLGQGVVTAYRTAERGANRTGLKALKSLPRARNRK